MSLDASIVAKTIFIVTEGDEDRQALTQLFQAQGFATQSFNNYQDYIDAPKSTLSQDVIDALNYMGDEERLAYDVYLKLYDSLLFLNI